MRDQIDALIDKRELDSLLSLIDGTNIQTFRLAARKLASALREDNEELFEHIHQWSSSSHSSAQHIACQLIPYAHAVKRKKAFEHLSQLVESEDWTVRDAACEVTGRLLREDFSRTIGVLEMWRSRASVNLYRAIIIAAIRASDPTHLERAEPLLNLLEPLLSEPEPLIRRNLGPSAIGATLLADYPGPTFEYLAKWSTSNDPQTLWNVSMAFSAPPAVAIAKKALIVLRKLSLDERRFVWRAVAASIWKLGRKRPDIIRPELARWLEDERRVNVAREAIKYL